MDVFSITTIGYGGKLCFLDETNLSYASGHGIIIQDKDSGQQRHIWTLTDGQGHPPPNMAPATFATCPGGHLLAYVQQGGIQQAIQVVQQETLMPASTIKQEINARHVEYTALAFDPDGTRLASIGNAPEHQLDVWDVDLKESLVRVNLTERLAGIEPAFFPLNSAVLAVAGPDAARLLWDEPLAGSRVVRQSEVDLAVLLEGERLNCICWTPNGTLLLGTTAGRVLGVRGAAPPAVPANSWGRQPGGGHIAELLYGGATTPPSPLPPPPAVQHGANPLQTIVTPPRQGVASIVCTATHVVLVMAGDATSPAELIWLSPISLAPIAIAPLPLRMLVRAVVSPSYEQLALAAADGRIVLCRANCPVPDPPSSHATGAGGLASEASGGPPSPRGTATSVGPAAGRGPSAHGHGHGASHGGAHSASWHGHGGHGGGSGHGGGHSVGRGPSTQAHTVAAAAAASTAAHGGGEAGEGWVVAGAEAPAPTRVLPAELTEVARFHRGRLSACLWLSATRFITGGHDGSVCMWSYVHSETDPPVDGQWSPPAVHLEATWHVSQPVTVMAALNPPAPPSGSSGLDSRSASGSGSGDGEGLHDRISATAVPWDGGGGGGNSSATPRPPAFMLGTAGGVVQVINTDRMPPSPVAPGGAAGPAGAGGGATGSMTSGGRSSGSRASGAGGTGTGAVSVPVGSIMAAMSGNDPRQLTKSLGSTWDVRIFNGPITAAAFSQDGRFCALACASEAKVAFLRVMVLGHELSMRLLGFYPLREPQHLAWGPPEPGGIHPLLVVGSILGEVLVLGLPDSSALEDGPPDGVLPRGCLLRGTMRAQSAITALTVYPGPAPDVRGGGHFWIITAHSDKSIRRYRLCTDQQKAAAAVAARANAVAAAAAADGVSSGGGSSSNLPAFRTTKNNVGAISRNISMAPSNQNFQNAEAEKPLELQLAATCLSISMLPGAGSGGGPAATAAAAASAGYGSPLRMAVACSDGTVALYSMPEIALQGRWLLHEMTSGGVMWVCLLGDRMLTVGGEGSVQVLELCNAARGPRHNTHRPSHGISGVPQPTLSPSPLSRPPVGAGAGGGAVIAAAQRSAFFTAAGPPRPKGLERATLGSLLPVCMVAVLPGIYTDADVAPTWQQARSQATQELYKEQLTSFRAKARAKCKDWMARIEELKKINEAADEVERLAPEEFVMDRGLQQQMAAEGEARYAAVKAALERSMRVMEFQRHRLKTQCLGAMECLSRPLMPLSEYSFISPMDPTEARKYRFDGEAAAARTAAEGGVWSYGMRKMSGKEELRLRQVTFLRKVEQAEMATRPATERGAVVPLRRYVGDMSRKFTLTEDETVGGPVLSGQSGVAANLTIPAQGQGPQGGPGGALARMQTSPRRGGAGGGAGTGGGTYDEDEDDDAGSLTGGVLGKGGRRARDDGFEGTELGYGEARLLYADVQLYTHCRRVAQLVIIQEEVRCLRRLFNARWEQSRTSKQKALDRIDERLGRIVEIHKELAKLALEEGAGEPPPPAPNHVPGGFYVWAPEEEGEALTEIRDDEVQAAKYVSPEELARRAAAAAAEEEARRRAEADDSRNRALKEMMNANPAASRKGGKGKNRMVREAWMDLPPGQLSKEQRIKLAEWEKKQVDMAEELDKHRRLLEAERRALEVDIVETAAAVNTDITRLQHARVRMDMEVVHLERRAVNLASTVAALAAAEATRGALVAQLSSHASRRSRRAPLLGAQEARVASAQRLYDDISFSEKQVDKAFKREFGCRPELWDDAQAVYKTRAHLLAHASTTSGAAGGLTGAGGVPPAPRLPHKSALELLVKCPEGVALASVLEAPGGGPEPSVAHSASSVGAPARATVRLNSRAPPGASLSEALAAGDRGTGGPDVLLTSPRSVQRDMAALARPRPRPGSCVADWAQNHMGEGRRQVSPNASSTHGGSKDGGKAAPPPPPRNGLAAVLHMAAEESSLARRGISQRPPGVRLKALAERAGRSLEILLQMVADGLPPSALCAELGPLGLQLPTNPLGNLNPFKVEGPGRFFDPEVTGAAEALGEAGGGAGGGSVGGGSTAGGSGGPGRERSSVSGGRSTNNGSVSPARGEDPNQQEDEDEEDPLDSAERPEGMDDAMWIRLLEFRQTRADLELEADDAWRRVCLLTAQLDWLEAEDAEAEAQVEEAGARAAALRDGGLRLALDVYLAYRLKNGQVELPERPGDVVAAGDVAADALILHRNRVESLNEEVLARGEGKIDILDTLRHTRRKIHLTQWETQAAEIAGQHAAQRLTELQLLHVTKDLQAALRDPTIVDRLNEEARLAVIWQSAANIHTHRLGQRRRVFGSLRNRVSRGGAEQSELSVAEAAAEAAFAESTRMHVMVSASRAAEDASHRRHMRNIVTNAQLRTIAGQQATELEELAGALAAAHARNFPSLVPRDVWRPPDYRPPSGAGGGSPPMSPPPSPPPQMAQNAEVPTGVPGLPFPPPPLPGSRPASSIPRGFSAASLASRLGTPVSRPGSRGMGGGGGMGMAGSGGAGASLTRAYTLASTGAWSGSRPSTGVGVAASVAAAALATGGKVSASGHEVTVTGGSGGPGAVPMVSRPPSSARPSTSSRNTRRV